ncbi:MAG TPA: hypothetical protein VHV55_17995 [Pirellulales bacterium]|nr:hypothetical protein [Pirellulales bacterium]
MDIDIDANGDDPACIFQISDSSVYIVAWVRKSDLPAIRRAIEMLRPGGETVFGAIGCGERVWVCRDEAGYAIAIGDTDGKDVWVRLSEADARRL